MPPISARRAGRAIGVLAAAGLFGALGSGTASAAIPIGQQQSGNMTYYTDAGYGACGTQINASTQYLVAVSYQWWTTANPNVDPLCSGISVKVSYQGKTITVPVEDKCPSCAAGHIDLSEPAFAELAPLSEGNVSGITWEFVQS